ncbi:MAG: transposase [Nitrospirae bacterium]|nr:transposase [Nitrospirota bacterium]
MNLSKQHFSFPPQLDPDLKVQFCLHVIDQYRRELPQLRTATTILKRQKKKSEEETIYWKSKYQEKQKENETLKKEIGKLQQEIEKLTKTTNRYRASLFDHGNFKAPTEEEKKHKGGQPGHADTNREQRENTTLYEKKRLFVSSCSRCGRHLPRVTAIQQKILLDIVLNPQVVRLIIQSERQWCGTCHAEVSARDAASLPFTEYGINTFMMALLLRYRCLLSLSKIAIVFAIGYGLDISESGLVSLFAQAKTYLGGRYEELKHIVRKGNIMYNDETGWQVKGKGAWMWIMAGDQATVYVAAESRGKGIARELYGNSQAYSMHDGLASYASSIPENKHLYCWSHLLRFCYEETGEKPDGHESVTIRDKLVEIYHLKKDPHYQNDSKRLEREISRRINHLLKRPSVDPTMFGLQHRLREQRDGLIRALLVTPNGTNNFAEQELRPIALARRISYGSDTYTGMETTAILSSVVQTLVRTKQDKFFPLLKASLRAGFANS